MRSLLKLFPGIIGFFLIIPGPLWSQIEQNPLKAYLTAPSLEVVKSQTLVPASVAGLLPDAGLVKFSSDQKKGLPLLFAEGTGPTRIAPVDLETVRGARLGVLATLASFDLNFTSDLEKSQLVLILVKEEEVENEEIVRFLMELVPGVEALFERTPQAIAREVFEELLHLIHYYIIDRQSPYQLLSEEIDKAYQESVRLGFYNPQLYREAYPEGDDIHPEADFVRGEYLATVAKVCFGFFEGKEHAADSHGRVEYPFTNRQEVLRNDPVSYRLFGMLFKESILRFDDILDVLTLNTRDKP
jgi:hypothetical protein